MLLHLIAGMAANFGEVFTLSGTSISPNTADANEVDPDTAAAGWIFNADGTVDKEDGVLTQFQPGIEWGSNQPTPTAGMYIRATPDSGNAPTVAASSAVNTWLALSGSRSWIWEQDEPGTNAGVVKVEIAYDAAGANIAATGYYEGDAQVFA
jgi:hypothetical protein